ARQYSLTLRFSHPLGALALRTEGARAGSLCSPALELCRGFVPLPDLSIDDADDERRGWHPFSATASGASRPIPPVARGNPTGLDVEAAD
ncbi:MAG TPA: hypothetical protein PLW75_04510, partial [Hyphomicrobium sp.]|nr:hypothetical protein [Hyphomicrobium sp.]